MSTRRERDFDNEARTQVIGTAIIIVLLIALLFAVSAWMYDAGMLSLPDTIERMLGLSKGDGDDVGVDLGELALIVRDERHPDVQTLTLETTLETLREAFLLEKAAGGMYISARVFYYDEGEAVPHRVTFRKNADAFRAEIYKDDSFTHLDSLKIGGEDTLFILDGDTGESRSLPLDPGFSAEEEAGIPSIADVIEAVEAFEQTDGEPLVTDTELRLVRYGEQSVYYVAFTWAGMGLREEYFVSLDKAIVLSCTTKRQGQTLYSFEALTSSVDPDTWESADYYSVINPR